MSRIWRDIPRTPYLPRSQGNATARLSIMDKARETALESQSREHLKALLIYGVNNRGLPNMTLEMCRDRLREMLT